MDNNLLLIRMLTLLYRESQLESADSSTVLVDNVLTLVPAATRIAEGDGKGEAIYNLRSTVEWMRHSPPGTKFEHSVMLQRIRLNVGSETYLYDVIAPDLNDAGLIEIEKQIVAIRREIKEWINNAELRAIIKKTSGTIAFGGSSLDLKKVIQEMKEAVEPYLTGVTGERAGALVGESDSRDVSVLKDLLTVSQESSSAKGSMRTGSQGLNRFFGDQEGIRRGDFILIGALQHNFKSGLLMKIARNICQYNKPYMLDDSKKPLVLVFSLENDIADNYADLYKDIKEAATGERVDTTNVPVEEMATFIDTELSRNGYHFKMLRYDPSRYTYSDMCSELLYFESQGYEIHACVNDYTNMMSKAGCVGCNEAAQIRDLFRRIRNFCSPRKIAYVTAHQLSPKAKDLVREGTADFVKVLPGKSYYADASGIDQEVDMEIYIHLERPGDGTTWITLQQGKHRKSGAITSEKDKFFTQKLEPIGGWIDDVFGKDTSRKVVGGSVVNGNVIVEESEWWANKTNTDEELSI